MRLVYDFDGGTPGLVERLGADRIRFMPYTNQSGCQWFYVGVRVEGLAAGRRAPIEIKRLPIWRETDCPPGAPPEQVRRWTTDDSFHERTGTHWQHASGGLTFAANFPRLTGGALAHTLEFSRHRWWDRATQTYVPAQPAFPERFAAQALDALAAYRAPGG